MTINKVHNKAGLLYYFTVDTISIGTDPIVLHHYEGDVEATSQVKPNEEVPTSAALTHPDQPQGQYNL